jgi:hypothetical protein
MLDDLTWTLTVYSAGLGFPPGVRGQHQQHSSFLWVSPRRSTTVSTCVITWLQQLSLRLLKIEPHVSKFGGLLRVHSGAQISFLQEIAPTRRSVFLALSPIEIIESSLRDLNSFYDGHNSARLVCSLVKPNDRE